MIIANNRDNLINKLELILNFKNNWNGHGAKMIPILVINKVINILENQMNYNIELYPTSHESIILKFNNVLMEIYKNKINVTEL